MGYGQYSNDGHKPFTKAELLATAKQIDGRDFIDSLATARLVAKNTLRYSVFRKPGIESVCTIYHTTRILDCTYDNQIQSRPLLAVTIDSGGWNTLTTRDRLNRFLPHGWHVYTDSGILFVTTPAGTFQNVDGATYDGSGKPLAPELHKDSRAAAILLKRKIDKFCRAIDSEGFPAPDAGDPWVTDWNPRNMGQDVLTEWLDSCYVNGSFIAAALARKGVTDAGIGMAFRDMQRDNDSHWKARIKRACRDYFKAGFGLA